jgi:hypothetical protein
MWVIPEVTSEFEEKMMDVLDVYAKPYSAENPVICLDEKNHQLLSDIRKQLPMSTGKCRRIDYGYRREGVRNEFVVVEPKAGRRHIRTTKKRAGRDWAKVIHFIVFKMYPNTGIIHIVLDNLNTHNIVYLYEVYGNDIAEEILSRIVLHNTPEHASWLNMAEIEISVFTKQVLKKRISDDNTLKISKNAYVNRRNKAEAKINWKFSKKEAIKIFRLKPLH